MRRALPVALALLLVAACREPPPPAAAAAPEQDLEAPAEVRLGRAIPGTTIHGEIDVRAQRATRLLAIAASCECTTSDVAVPRDLAAGERLVVPVTIDLSKLGNGGVPREAGPGAYELHRQITLETTAGRREVALLVEVSDLVRLEPPSAWLGTVAIGAKASGSVRVLPGRGASAVHVLEATSSDAALRATVSPAGPGDDVLLEWAPDGLGTHRATVSLRLDAAADPVATVPVSVDVLPPVRVKPERIENLEASLTQPVVARLTVDRLDGEELVVTGVSTDNHRVTARLLPGGDRTRTVEVVIPVPSLPAEQAGTVTIATSVPGAPTVIVPFRVKARGSVEMPPGR